MKNCYFLLLFATFFKEKLQIATFYYYDNIETNIVTTFIFKMELWGLHFFFKKMQLFL